MDNSLSATFSRTYLAQIAVQRRTGKVIELAGWQMADRIASGPSRHTRATSPHPETPVESLSHEAILQTGPERDHHLLFLIMKRESAEKAEIQNSPDLA